MDLLAFCSVHFIISDMICVLYLGCPPGSLRLLRRLTDRQQYLIFTHDKQCKQYHHENKSSYLPWSYQDHGLYFQTYSQLCLYVYLFFSPISILTSQVEKSLTRPEKKSHSQRLRLVRGAVAHLAAAGRRGGRPLLSSLHDSQVIVWQLWDDIWQRCSSIWGTSAGFCSAVFKF